MGMIDKKNININTHFRKKWQMRFKKPFNRSSRKIRRSKDRYGNSKNQIFSSTRIPLHPIVHCQTIKFNKRDRKGRGFTKEELKATGINVRTASKLSIAIDSRRKNRTPRTFYENVKRIKNYKTELVLSHQTTSHTSS